VINIWLGLLCWAQSGMARTEIPRPDLP